MYAPWQKWTEIRFKLITFSKVINILKAERYTLFSSTPEKIALDEKNFNVFVFTNRRGR